MIFYCCIRSWPNDDCYKPYSLPRLVMVVDLLVRWWVSVGRSLLMQRWLQDFDPNQFLKHRAA